MTAVWLTIVGEGAVLFGIAAGVTAWVRSKYAAPAASTPCE